MYLKAVEINGFKSFAERVRVDFDNGITSIVGPNGSGKSNILDATLWVLGEQSYKNIRAKESTDVIFSGGKGRGPKNTAEVSLYIDNTDRTLALEADEIKVTRKLYREGRNEYSINDGKARLKDINELFMDTGVGKSAYSVIGQGKVERIISSSSTEIRAIIEEAAGIKKVKVRKGEALKKLERVQGEVEKIALILGELEDNKVKIERQATKAIKHKELTDRSDLLAKGINIKEMDIILNKLEFSEKEIEELKVVVEEAKTQFNVNEKELEEINKQREGLSQEIEELSEKNVYLKKDIDKLVNDRTMYGERKKSYLREIDEKNTQAQLLDAKLGEKVEEIQEIQVKIEVMKEELIKQERENLEFDREIEETNRKKREIEISVSIKKDKLMNYEVDRLRHISDLENSSKRMKSSHSRLEDLRKEVEGFEVKLKENATNYERQKGVLAKKEEEYLGIDAKLEALEEEISTISIQMNKVFESMREVDYNLKRHGAKLENLIKLDENNEGFYKGVKEVLNSSLEGIEGAFISLIDIPSEYERAIEAAIPGNLQDIIVRDSEVAKDCIALLKSKKAGRASFLALDTIRSGTKATAPIVSGVIGIGSELLSYDSKYAKVAQMLLGNLLVVENMNVAVSISKKNLHRGNIVTLDGELVSSRGRITGGDSGRSITHQILERKKEIKELSQVVKNLKIQHADYDSNYQKLSGNMESIEERLVSMDDFKETLKIQVKTSKEALDDLTTQGEKLLKNKKVVELEYSEEENYIKEFQEIEKTAKEKQEDVEKRMNSLRGQVEEESTTLSVLISEIDSLKERFSDKKIRFLNNRESVKQRERELERVIITKEEVSTSIRENTGRIKNLTLELKEIDENLISLESAYENENLRYQKEFLEIKEKRDNYSTLEAKEKDSIRAVKDSESKIVIKTNKLSSMQENHEKLSITKAKLEEVSSNLAHIETAEIIESLEESKEELLKLEARVKNLGIVNLLAIEEFEEVKKKFDFISHQKEDLLKSERSLRDLIKDIEGIVEIKFIEAYKAINTNFGYMCQEILNNSEGKLELNDRDNILESGIELMVKFNNKKRQSITLLSGGEKSMVAVAFIMGIFMYKPSPFTFFDEIEAALDEANTKRLINKLKEFTDRSQFILITHNKETMRASDTLYGVTMDKKIGESKLLSVNTSDFTD